MLFHTNDECDRALITQNNADIIWWRHWLTESTALFDELIDTTPWQQDSIKLWGKTHPQPRLTAWFSDAKTYRYSGITLHSLPWPPALQSLRQYVEKHTQHEFNAVLLNYYRDNRDSMGFHADDEQELGKNPAIASLSLGDSRRFLLKHKKDKSIKPIQLQLNDGDLLLMQGPTQHFWKHGIPKQAQPCGPRINLTFRKII